MDLPRNLLKIFYTPFSTTFYFIVIRKIYLGGYDEMVKHLCMSMAASFIQMSFVLLLLTLVLGAAYLPHFTALHSQSSASPVDYANYHARRLCNHHEYGFARVLISLSVAFQVLLCGKILRIRMRLLDFMLRDYMH
nr:PREDICTED: uncharacterized protein LOC108223005 isoform X3 [Daucus carota subsp. sativus]